MKTNRISDDEAAAVLRGRTPSSRDDLAPVVDAVATFRRASLAAPPQPSAALAARLDLERAARIATSAGRTDAPASEPVPATRARVPGRRGRRAASGAFAGLGLAAKVVIGATAATAIGLAGAGAAGAAGVLPTDAQVVFEQVTGQHPGGEHVSESGLERSEPGLDTAEQARESGEAERESAPGTAEEQPQAGLETAERAGRVAEPVEPVDPGEPAEADRADAPGEPGAAGPQSADDPIPAGRDTAEDASRAGPEVADRATTENVPPTTVGGPKD